jgi:fibronectin type 3 domain-containing protein
MGRRLLMAMGVLLFGLIVGVVPAFAAEVALDWDDNAAGENITEYKVYRSDDGSNFVEIGTSPTSDYLDANVAAGKYWYRVTALNMWQESAPSDTVQTPFGPSPPTGITISINITIP